jgi:nitrite reductase (NADH) large subunit
MTTYLIIGNGVAGNTAAETIRKIDPQGNTRMFSREKYYFYYVPALPEYLAGRKQLKDFTIHPESWYEKNRIEIHLATEIVEIKPPSKEVVAKNGRSYSYDKLLLACGGNSFLPPIPGSQSPGVYTLRTVDDANRIREKAQQSRKVVVIGGGLLGLEAGNGLRQMGLEVWVVEFSPRLLPRQMDVAGANLLKSQMEEMGFGFYLGAKTREIIPEKDGLQVCLEGGEKIGASMVLISAGVRPELGLSKSLNLPIDKGVKVDDRMKTGVEGIFAAGDLVEHRGRYYGIWPASMEQGRVAGANMAGQERLYEGTIPSNVLKVAGIDLVATGEIDPEGKLEAIVGKDEARRTYRKLVLKDNRIVGAILLGNIRGSQEVQKAIEQQKDVSAFKERLGDESFDFSRLL